MKTKLDCLKLINFIEKSIDFKKNILPCKNILIAYSGGQDSSALLVIFYILSKKWHFNIGVVYCNHNWIHSTKASSTAFDIIQNLNLPFYFVDSKRAIKPENQARNWRYKAFATILNNSQYDLILTGHTLSDCAETIIFNLCRGSGLKGVCSLKKFQVFNQEEKDLFQFQIKTFSAEDFKISSSRTFPLYGLNKNLFQISSTLSFSTVGHRIFNCYSEKQHNRKLSKAERLPKNESKFQPVNAKRLPTQSESKAFNFPETPQKNDSCEQFFITFFDPMIYLFATERVDKTRTLYFYSYYVCSLFSNLKFYLSSNLKVERDATFCNKMTFFQQGFSQSNLNCKLPSTLLFFIQQGLKNKKNKVKFNALLNRKLKQKVVSTTPFFYFLRPTFICPLVSSHSFLFNQNELTLAKSIQIDYYLHSSNFQIKRSPLHFTNDSTQYQSKLIIYRPLIGIDREVTALFTQQLNLSIIMDQSNNDVNLTRNFIRMKILPLLKQINPQVEQNLYKFSQIAAFYLDQTGDINFDLKNLNIFKP